MKMHLMFLDCPAFLDDHGALRCGLPAEVEYRYTVESSGGLLESAKIRCPRGHWFNGPVEFLTWDRHIQPRCGNSSPAAHRGLSKPPDT